MKTYSIIWDFDGTIIPSEPHDSEQTLLVHRLNRSKNEIPLFRRLAANVIVYVDKREKLWQPFCKLALPFFIGAESEIINQVAGDLSDRISEEARHVFRTLNKHGHQMIVLSCGIADLSESVLKKAGLRSCFEIVEGNRFEIVNGRIAGMVYTMANPQDKVNFLQEKGIRPEQTVAIGDGYTDIPLLDWAKIPIMLNKNGKKKRFYGHKNYIFISKISEIIPTLGKTNI